MRVSLHLCVLAVIALTLVGATSQANNQTQSAQPQGYGFPWATPQAGDLSGAFGAIAAVQVQQQLSLKYGKLLLDYQSSMGWIQVAQGWASMTTIENKGAANLEEDEDEDEDENTPNYDEIEKQTEQTLLYVLKIMYLQAAQKLNDARQSNYQTKLQLAVLQQVGAGNPAISSVLYLMYYLESIRLLSSAITIQRQDSWNNWLLHEIMETNEFGNSEGEMPATFGTVMAQSRVNAMQLYYTEAMYDFQIFYLEYYLQMITGSLISPQSNAASASASSFLEEEMTAEPNKPFAALPLMMMGGAGGPYLSYMAMFIKYFAITMNVQAAQGLFTHAQAELSGNGNANAGQIKLYAVNALQQWAYLKFQYAMIQMWGLFSGQPVPSHAAAASNSALLQTGAEQTTA